MPIVTVVFLATGMPELTQHLANRIPAWQQLLLAPFSETTKYPSGMFLK